MLITGVRVELSSFDIFRHVVHNASYQNDPLLFFISQSALAYEYNKNTTNLRPVLRCYRPQQ